MRSIGRTLPAIGTLPSAEALRTAASHLRTALALAPLASTGIVKGVYRFASHEQAQAQADAAIARVMAECEKLRRALR